jgi:integrase
MKDGTTRNLLPLNAKVVKAARSKSGKPTEYRFKDAKGLVLLVQPPAIAERDPKAKGAASFYCYYHSGKGARRKLNKVRLGSRDVTPLVDACERAKQIMRGVEAGRDPVAERASTVDALLDDHVKRHVRPNLRSAGEIERVFDVYIRPEIGGKSLAELKRRDIVAMLDKVADTNGLVMSDRVLAHLRKAFNWHAARDDNFNSPIVKGMSRTSPTKRSRKRKLDDQEIRDLWEALDVADVPSCYPALVRFLLLSARRKGEPTNMQWQEVEGDVWVIPAERGNAQGHKTADETGDMAIPLTPALLALMGKPHRKGYVFTTTEGHKAFDGFGKAQRLLIRSITELRENDGRPPMPHWTLHDLRRTGRSLMSRAGVDWKHAELAMGHKIKGVERTYDRHEYVLERRDALERLAKLVAEIVGGKARKQQEQQPAEAAAPAL